jgi:cephalosporin hydroxylase
MFLVNTGTLGSGLCPKNLGSIRHDTLSYVYNRIPCVKSAFHIALYPQSISRLKPKTIIDIGFDSGEKTIWFHDLDKSFDLPTETYSLELNPGQNLRIKSLFFLFTDFNPLEQFRLREILSNCESPLLADEDESYTCHGCTSEFKFFYLYSNPKEYLVIEFDIVHDARLTTYADNPNRAISEYLIAESNWEIDTDFCDYFSQNFTSSTNGNLRIL